MHLADDLEILAGGDDERAYTAPWSGPIAVTLAVDIGVWVDANAEECAAEPSCSSGSLEVRPS